MTVTAGTCTVTEGSLPPGWVSNDASMTQTVTLPIGGTGTATYNNSLPSTAIIAPTSTTCTDFTSGTASNLAQIQYSTKAGKISQNSQGVFFYYSKITSPASSFVIDVTQTNLLQQTNPPGWPPFAPLSVDQQQIVLCNSACAKQTSLYTPSFSTTSRTTTLTVTGATAGSTYIIGIKYDTSSILGIKVPPFDNTYTFSTNINNALSPGSTASVDVRKK